jgi:electron transfer flavoprotein beta subunit
LSAQQELTEPRIPNMRGIMAARTKPLKVIEATVTQATTIIKQFNLPPTKSGVKLVDPANMDELVRLLKEEAKVI